MAFFLRNTLKDTFQSKCLIVGEYLVPAEAGFTLSGLPSWFFCTKTALYTVASPHMYLIRHPLRASVNVVHLLFLQSQLIQDWSGH